MPWNNWVGESRVHCSRVMMLDGRRHVYQNTWAELMEDEGAEYRQTSRAGETENTGVSLFLNSFHIVVPRRTFMLVWFFVCLFVYFPLPLKRKSSQNNAHYTLSVCLFVIFPFPLRGKVHRTMHTTLFTSSILKKSSSCFSHFLQLIAWHTVG